MIYIAAFWLQVVLFIISGITLLIEMFYPESRAFKTIKPLIIAGFFMTTIVSLNFIYMIVDIRSILEYINFPADKYWMLLIFY